MRNSPKTGALAAVALMLLLIPVAAFILAAEPDHAPREYVVNQKHPAASDRAEGTEAQPLATISRAAFLARPGDTVTVHAGIYRERISPASGGKEGKPIVYQSAPGEKVFVRGSEVFSGKWTPVEEHAGVFSGDLDPAMFQGWNPFRIPCRCMFDARSLGQVFVNGIQLKELRYFDDVYATPMSWKPSSGGERIVLNVGPDQTMQDKVVELSVRRRIFAPETRGLGYIVVRGFIFEHACNESAGKGGRNDEDPPPQAGAVGCRSGHHWTIENNTIRFARAAGLDIGRESGRYRTGPCPHCAASDGPAQSAPALVGYHVIRNNVVRDNGEAGIIGADSIGTAITGNIVERNGADAYSSDQKGGINLSGFINGSIEGNLVRNNEAPGINLHNVFQGTRVTRNLLLNNVDCGLRLERGAGYGLIDNNIVMLNRGNGIDIRSASMLMLAHNLVAANRDNGVQATRGSRSRYPVFPPAIISFDTPRLCERSGGSRNITIRNNIIVNNPVDIAVPTNDNTVEFNILSGDSDATDGTNIRIGRPPIELKGEDKVDLKLTFPTTASHLACMPVFAVITDIHGSAIGQNPRPGPIQSLAPGANETAVWPVKPGIRAADGPIQIQPAAPAGLASSQHSSRSLSLRWDESSNAAEDAFAYVIQRDGSNIATIIANSYRDDNVKENETHEYSVVAVNRGRNVSSPSRTNITSSGDSEGPRPISVLSTGSMVSVTLVFDEPLEAVSAAVATNYSINNGAFVISAMPVPDGSNVVLTISNIIEGTRYSIAVWNVTDTSVRKNIVAPGTEVSFLFRGMRKGLLGRYYANINFSGVPKLREDRTVDFDFNVGSPMPELTPDQFSIRWSGRVIPKHSERYTFHVSSDDGVRLWINDKLIIEDWYDRPTTESVGFADLQAGEPAELRMEYYEAGGTAAIVLEWSSPSTPRQVIPEDCLMLPLE